MKKQNKVFLIDAKEKQIKEIDLPEVLSYQALEKLLRFKSILIDIFHNGDYIIMDKNGFNKIKKNVGGWFTYPSICAGKPFPIRNNAIVVKLNFDAETGTTVLDEPGALMTPKTTLNELKELIVFEDREALPEYPDFYVIRGNRGYCLIR